MANEKLSQLPTNNSPVTTDSIVSIQSPGVSPQDVQVPISKLMNPALITNPYKFSVYRAAALTSSSSQTVVAMDTKLFDSGNNIDVVTNKGRFTAPVAGFYFFCGEAGNTGASSTATYAFLWKNGGAVKRGSGAESSSVGTHSQVSGLIQLAANDYVELAFIGGNGSTMDVGQSQCYFDGFLSSAL